MAEREEQFVLRHKNLIMSIVAFVVLAIPILGIWRYNEQKAAGAYADAVYRFENGEFASFKEDKIGPPAVLARFGELYAEGKGRARAVALGLEVADHFASAGKPDEALEVLGTVKGDGNRLQQYMTNIRMAVLYEDKGQIGEAISTLEELVESSNLPFEEKVYLDLGRLYAANGEDGQAETYFRYVVDNGEDDEVLKLAKLYLDGLSK